MKLFLLLSIAVFSRAAEVKDIVKNEDDFFGSCTGTCSDITFAYNKFGCARILNCRLNSEGWTRGFVRCDYCKCKCELPEPGVVSVEFTEPDLYGTCTGTCKKRGVVRTNFRGYYEVFNCDLKRKGWTRGFVRCDYCQCEARKNPPKKQISSYYIYDVTYDTNKAQMKNIGSVNIAETTVVTNTLCSQSVTGKQTIEYTTKSVVTTSTTASLEYGVSTTLSAQIPAVVSGSVTYSAKMSTQFQWGKSKETTFTHKREIPYTAEPRSELKVHVLGTKTSVDVPYTAKRRTKYTDGTSKVETINGFVYNVGVHNINLEYVEKKLPHC